jgi:hypothetical protein
MLERLKFLRSTWDSPYLHDRETGYGYKLLSYNPFTDTCAMRLSRFGYVEGYGFWPRSQFESNLSRLGRYS